MAASSTPRVNGCSSACGARASIAVIDLHKRAVVQTLPTEPHPTEMLFGPDEKTLFVACSNSTRVSVIDMASGKPIETINAAIYPNAPSGNTPSSLSLTPDGTMLFVANAEANNVAVFNVAQPGKSQPLGFIPTGMYPTSVRFNSADSRIYIANGQGATPKANPQRPQPAVAEERHGARVHRRAVSRHAQRRRDAQRGDDGPLHQAGARVQSVVARPRRRSVPRPEGNPIPAKVGGTSPIKYCIYVIRENRTYDQVFGDIKRGNGDPNLCIFPEKITPNAHRLAQQFVLLDNFYCDGEVSAEGHEWSMGAYCTDFVKKLWPLSLSRQPDEEAEASIRPRGTSMRSPDPPAATSGTAVPRRRSATAATANGCNTGKTLKDPSRPRVKALEGHIDPGFRGWDLDYPDVKRADRFLEEMKRFEKEGGMPQLSIVRLGNDHTDGTEVGKPTPTAMVAENDLALGLLGRRRSRRASSGRKRRSSSSRTTPRTAPTTSMPTAPSPWRSARTRSTARVDSTMYSTSAMLRTMELILGLKPMSQFDAAARPMYAAFQAKANLAPYKHVVPQTDLKAKNTRTAWGAQRSERFDFTREDAADDLLLNEVIWRSVRGANSPMPPPVRAAFVFPHVEDD